jgi:hypothetical protein
VRDPKIALDQRSRLGGVAIHEQQDAQVTLQEIDEVAGPDFRRHGERLV